MAKPTKTRDLRARLGRTITPKTPGGGGAPVAPPGAGAPPPTAGAEAPAATQGQSGAPASVTPPAGVSPPRGRVAAPPVGMGGVAAPPFAQKPAAPAAPADPFAAVAGAQPVHRTVRLEFDDKLVEDKEVGKAQRFKLVIVAAVTLAAGLGVGFFGGSTFENRKIFDRTVRDAQSIYQSVNEASVTVNAAQRHINTIVQAAAGSESEGTTPMVDYATITALRALEKPFDTQAFTGKNYNALAPNTVHDIFDYLMNIEQLWREFTLLASMTLAETARGELNRTAAETTQGATTNYGAVIVRPEEGGMLVGSLAYISEAGEGAEPGQVLARATRTGPGRTLSVYTGLDDPNADELAPGQMIEPGSPLFVMLLDNAGSRGVLAEQTGAFGRFLNKLREIKPLVDQTVEIQGRLLSAISAALTEAGASVSAPAGGE